MTSVAFPWRSEGLLRACPAIRGAWIHGEAPVAFCVCPAGLTREELSDER